MTTASPQRPRPVPDLRGLHRRAGAARHARPGARRPTARLPPLLGRRAPRRRRCSPAPSPEVLIGPIAAGHAADPRRQRRRDAAALQPAQGRGELQPARGLFPGRIDLGLGRASGTDPMTTYALQRDRRQAAPDDFLEQLAELLAYFDDALPRRPSRSRAPGRAARAARGAGALAARLLAAERDLGRAARPPLRVRGLHQPRRRGDRRRSYRRALRARRPARGARDGGRRLGAGRGRCRGGVAADRVAPDGDGDAAPRPADPRAAGRAGACASSRPSGDAAARRRDRRRRSPRPVRAGLEEVGAARTAPTR